MHGNHANLTVVLGHLGARGAQFAFPYCNLGESYQPRRILAFFNSPGQRFHKYGVMPNVLLAPGYALSLGYWNLQGSFADLSEDFPYRFKNPLEQIGFLILLG